VRAFSLILHITQRDGRQGRDMPGSRALMHPGCLCRTGWPRRDVPRAQPACRRQGQL